MKTNSILFSYRTPSQCHKQSVELVMDESEAGECGKPNKYKQELTNGVSEFLNCPLEHYINTLKSYNISFCLKWYNVSYTETCNKTSNNLHSDVLAIFDSEINVI